MKRILSSILAFSVVFTILCAPAQAAAAGSSSSVISAALSQIDHQEGPRSYSEYGQWYGTPYGDWCDMFVSWCANQAGVPKSVFPRSAGCTTHVRLFNRITPYQLSAARGGSYVPKQGDVIFFYDYVEYPKANIVRHAGIVLCVENGYVFTIEGNTITNRLDYSYYGQVAPLFNTALQPPDYVAVKCYPLNEPQIHGYASPNYADRSAYAHNGWVDLGKYEYLRGAFNTLASQNIMPGTSSYTFSPRYGMTRGDFLTSIMNLYGLYGWEEDTVPFSDIPESSVHYNAAMAARSAGIVNGTGRNTFAPNIYISGAEAQAIISRTLAYVGQEKQLFNFSQGDLSYMLTPYTVRADIACALYTLLSKMPIPAQSPVSLLLNGEPLEWPMLRVNGSMYVPLEALQQVFPELEVSNTNESDNQPVRLPVPVADTDRVLLSKLSLRNGEKTTDVTSFCYHRTEYVMLHPVANLLGVALQWPAGSNVIELFQEIPAT